MQKKYYEILEVSARASSEVIEKAYKTLVKKYHPDNNQGNEEYAKKLILINEAYEILSDETKRVKYDQDLLEEERRRASTVRDKERTEQNFESTFGAQKTQPETTRDVVFTDTSQNNAYLNVLNEYRSYLDDLKNKERWARGEYTKEELKRIRDYKAKIWKENFYLNIKTSFYMAIFFLGVILICMLPPMKGYIEKHFLQSDIVKAVMDTFRIK